MIVGVHIYLLRKLCGCSSTFRCTTLSIDRPDGRSQWVVVVGGGWPIGWWRAGLFLGCCDDDADERLADEMASTAVTAMRLPLLHSIAMRGRQRSCAVLLMPRRCTSTTRTNHEIAGGRVCVLRTARGLRHPQHQHQHRLAGEACTIHGGGIFVGRCVQCSTIMCVCVCMCGYTAKCLSNRH